VQCTADVCVCVGGVCHWRVSLACVTGVCHWRVSGVCLGVRRASRCLACVVAWGAYLKMRRASVAAWCGRWDSDDGGVSRAAWRGHKDGGRPRWEGEWKVAPSRVSGVARWRREGSQWRLQRGVRRRDGSRDVCPLCCAFTHTRQAAGLGASGRPSRDYCTGGSLGWLAPPDPPCGAEVAAYAAFRVWPGRVVVAFAGSRRGRAA